VKTIRVYRDGESPETAVEATGRTTAAAERVALRRLGLPVPATSREQPTLLGRLSSRHRVIKWAGVCLHVLEESRGGAPRSHEAIKAAGLRRVEVNLSPEAGRALDRLVERLGSNRAAIEFALATSLPPATSPDRR
jgi:hypothetical protein